MSYDPSKATPFARFGLPEDADSAAVKKAYAAALKANRPEDDPKAFMALRQDYQLLRKASKSPLQDVDPPQPLPSSRTIKPELESNPAEPLEDASQDVQAELSASDLLDIVPDLLNLNQFPRYAADKQDAVNKLAERLNLGSVMDNREDLLWSAWMAAQLDLPLAPRMAFEDDFVRILAARERAPYWLLLRLNKFYGWSSEYASFQRRFGRAHSNEIWMHIVPGYGSTYGFKPEQPKGPIRIIKAEKRDPVVKFWNRYWVHITLGIAGMAIFGAVFGMLGLI